VKNGSSAIGRDPPRKHPARRPVLDSKMESKNALWKSAPLYIFRNLVGPPRFELGTSCSPYDWDAKWTPKRQTREFGLRTDSRSARPSRPAQIVRFDLGNLDMSRFRNTGEERSRSEWRTLHIRGSAVRKTMSPPGQDPSLRAAFGRRWPSTTSPSLRASTGTLKPNSRMLAHMRSAAASFLRGLRA
jgi:hypothetical protein